MFHAGEYVVYGNNGVCKVESIVPAENIGLSNDREYYVLSVVNMNGNKVFTPVDNDKVIIRPVITRPMALGLMEKICELEDTKIENEKLREAAYKEALKSCDCEQILALIKTILQRRHIRIEAGKKLIASDEKYLHLAEESLYGELALTLDTQKEQIKEIVHEKIQFCVK